MDRKHTSVIQMFQLLKKKKKNVESSRNGVILSKMKELKEVTPAVSFDDPRSRDF